MGSVYQQHKSRTMKSDKALSIYIFLVLFIFQSGMKIPLFFFLTGNSKYIFAVVLLIIGAIYGMKRKKLSSNGIGLSIFWWLFIALVCSVFMAEIAWGQSYGISIELYRNNIWILFLPVLLSLQPSMKAIGNALYWLVITALIVWIGNVTGVIPPVFHETIWGEVLDSTNEFGGYAVPAERMMVFAFYFFLGNLTTEFTKINIFRTVLAFILVLFTTQRSLIFISLPILIYAIFFKMNLSRNNQILIACSLIVILSVFFVQTQEVWLGFFEETQSQLGDKDYNRWKAIDYFLNNYGNGIFTTLFGNGFLSLRNSGGVALYELGYSGIFIDDIGMIGVWVRYGIIPIIIQYYLVIKVLFSRTMPISLKFFCIHIGVLPTAWTLIGPHYFAFILFIYMYCYFKDKRYKYNAKLITIQNNTHYV